MYLSVDPYMRAFAMRLEPGITMIGGQVAKVLESNSPDYEVGSHVWGHLGWRNKTVFNVKEFLNDESALPPYVLPSIGDLPLSLGIGALGMPG